MIVLVNGLPGAGKSTVARGIAARLPRAAVVDGDHLQHGFTVSGLVEPGGQPEAEAWSQLHLRWRNIAALTANFHDAGFDVIVDSLVIPALLEAFAAAIAPRPWRYLHLDPDDDVRAARDLARGVRAMRGRYDYIASEFEALRDAGPWLDSSSQSVEETVADAVRRLALA